VKPLARDAAGAVAGFLVTAAASIGTTALLRLLWPDLGTAGQSGALETLDGIYAVLYMGLGGFVAARIGRVEAGFVLTGIFVVLGILTVVLGLDPGHSTAYLILVAVFAAPAGLLGSLAGRRPSRDAARSRR
jgi:hypothetical protein